MISIVKTVSVWTFLLIATASSSCWAQTIHTIQPESYRSKVNFNRNWKFQLGDYKGAEDTEFNDDKWQSIGIPHSFSIPYFLSPDFYVGYGWYRKHFEVPANYKNKRLFLEFEAAFQHAEVLLNSKEVGEHKGGYTGFFIDISNVIKEVDLYHHEKYSVENFCVKRLNSLLE